MKNTLVLTLDYINDIVNENGKIARYADRITTYQVLENANKVLKWARDNSMAIAHVKVGFSPNYLECPKNSPMFSKSAEFGALKLGTWGCDFDKRLNVEENDFVIIKHRVSAFYNTDLGVLLSALKIEKIIMLGVATNYAIDHSARDAHDRDYEVVVVTDASQAHSDQAHEASLESIGRFSQLIKVDDLIS
ncbi:cysteine hydrolase [Thiotrichales bacterium 19S3-7]|nr:cysteine hydrolase [Thiotrichales bacterium 19S3-7]MCF6801073.1 cysteine hydrolase [Thiotrichales bacterium 19S3-11]